MREKIVVGNIYHVLSRGVDKRQIFMDDEDRFRFVHDLFEFNDTQPINNVTYNFKVIGRPYIVGGGEKNNKQQKRQRKLLVEILAFCIMPNHYHILLRPLHENAVTKFMKRLNMGYARYFNERYERSGALFESKYKSIAVNNEAHLTHLPYYIHLNPLDMAAPEWRKRKLRDRKKAVKFLETYRWSSHLDYLGKKNFPSVTQRDFLTKLMGEPKEYEKSISEWLKDIDTATISDATLE